jgi:uncharacterized protein (DUF362 family)
MAKSIVSLSQLTEGEDDDRALRRAVDQLLEPWGGVGNLVTPGARVLIKPNQTLFLPSQSGCTTSAPLVRVLARACHEAGASDIWVAEASGHAQRSRTVMQNTGFATALADSPAKLIYLDEIAERLFDFGEDAGSLQLMPAPEIMDRADVIINVPKAKTHFVDPISGACKNWVGVVPMSYRLALQREVWPYYIGTALFLKRFRPTISIFDGIWAGQGQGPGSNEPFWWGALMASDDPAAADTTLARLFGLTDKRIRMADAAAEQGVGTTDPQNIEIAGDSSERLAVRVRPADPSIHRFPCNVIAGQGPGATMEGTLGHWKTIADGWLEAGVWNLLTLRGRPTFMFGDVEDPDFAAHLEEGPYVVLDDAARPEYKYHPKVTFVPGAPVPQSYMQNEMVEGMGFGWIYQKGLAGKKLLESIKGRMAA